MRIFYLLFVLILLSACQTSDTSPALDALEYELEKAKKELAIAQGDLASKRSGTLIHTVYFDLKTSLTARERTAFVQELSRLKGIPEVYDFRQGGFEDLADKRALSEYEWAIEMTLKDKAAYSRYQASAIHQEVKAKLVAYLAKAPASYDFIRE